MSMDAFSFKPFDHPPLSADAAAGPSSAPQPGTRRRQRRRGGGGVKLSTDPQSVAARERRHRISHRFKILQSLVPGGSKMDTVSMLEEAIHYVKFLQEQISLHHSIMATSSSQEDPADAFAAPAGVAAGAPPPAAALISPSYCGARVASISSSTESSLLLPQEAFSYPLPSFPPLPGWPAYAYQEEDEQLFPDLWFDNDC